MGFGSNGSWWKKKLAEWDPSAWYYLNEAPVDEIELVIEDIMFWRFSTRDSKRAYQELWNNYAADIFKEFPNATEVVALFDEQRSMVPKAKYPEQDERNAKRKYKGLSPDDLKKIGDKAKYLCNSASDDSQHAFDKAFPVNVWAKNEPDTSFRAFLTRYQNTPELKQDYMNFLTLHMSQPSAASQIHFRPGKLLRIDRGSVAGEKKTMLVNHEGHVKYLPEDDVGYIPGEGDLRIGDLLRKNKHKKGVWIRCADMDVIPIVLMAMRDLINRQSKLIEGRVFLDLTPSFYKTKSLALQKKRPPQVVDAVALWRAINSRLTRKYSIRSRPVETLCVFMILCGTDFVQKPARIGIESLWGAFANGGYLLLSRCFKGDNIIGEANWEGKAGSGRWIRVDEKAILHFYRYAYTYFKDKKSLASIPLLKDGYEEAKKDLLKKSYSFQVITEKYAPKKITSASLKRKRVLTHETAKAEARRVTWNAYYWMSGHAYPPPNAIQIHPRKGISMYGWEVNPETGRVVRSNTVCSSGSLNRVLSGKRRKKNPAPPHATAATKIRTKCQYGSKCYRKNKDHLRAYMHPSDSDWIHPAVSRAISVDLRTR